MDQIQTQTNVRSGSIEAKDPFAQSIPGTSLTTDNKKWAWGNPPENSDPEVVLQEATDRLDDPRFREDMMKLLLAGVSIEHIVETWVIDGFESGKFSLDVGMLTKGPLGVYIAYVAEQEDVPYRMFEKEDGGYSFIGFRGLASHGATIGILIGISLYQRIYKFKPLIWILDRLTIPVAIGGFFVRTGNFFNSEIVGKYTGSNFGVVFENRGEVMPRYPAQMYEAFGYLILFFILRKLYKIRFRDQGGFLLGLFFIGLFSIRFLVEYVKESQGGFEEMMPMFSTGQWLSMPFIALGIVLLAFSFRKKTTPTIE